MDQPKTNPMAHALKYRSDIDGLRALAVIPVILYHLGSPVAPGGFIGVDVFFVISGYLITSVIRTEIEESRFSLLRFYERRSRRILPALFATSLATLLAGLWLFMPDELADLGLSLVSVAVFASNFLFWHQTDYFAGPVELKPLIHTWSLAVEEQYYILFPLMIMAIARWGRRRYFWPTAIISLLSFVASVALLKIDPTGDYYLLPTRAWELLAGSLLAYGGLFTAHRRWLAEALALAGLAAILAGVVLLDHNSPFPAYNALWPTVGAAAIIAAGTHGSTTVGRVLGAKPLVAIGLVSYSLYLVHWPLIVFVRYALLRPPTTGEQVIMVALMAALAWASWRYIERPFRNRHRFSQRHILYGAMIGLGVAAALGGVTFYAKGFPQRFPGLEAVTVRNETEGKGPPCFVKGSWREWAGDACVIVRNAGPVTLLWGDSHANHYWRQIRDLSPRLHATVIYYGSAGCQPILDYDFPERRDCAANNRHALAIIKAYKVQTVVLSAYWYPIRGYGLGPSDIADTVARLKRLGLRVKIIGDNPDFPVSNPQFLAYRLSQRDKPNAPFFMPTRNDWSTNTTLRKIVGPDNFFDPLAQTCVQRQCLIFTDGHVLMTDNAHLSPFGSARLVSRMRAFLER